MNILEDLKTKYKIGGIAVKLIFWNIVLFIIPEIIFGLFKRSYFEYVGLSCNCINLLHKPWTIVSYYLFHNTFIHLASNMIVLYFVSRLFVTFFSQRQLLSVYILGGIFAGFVYLLFYTFLPEFAQNGLSMVGASGCVMTILFAVTTLQPQMDVDLFGVFKVRLWYIATAILMWDFYQLFFKSLNDVANIAHIGGALFGFIYVRMLQKGIDLGSGLNTILDKIVVIFSPKKVTPFKSIHRNPKPKDPVKTGSKVIVKDKNQQQIDEILDKIGKSGYDSLTAAEKDFLFKAGKSE